MTKCPIVLFVIASLCGQNNSPLGEPADPFGMALDAEPEQLAPVRRNPRWYRGLTIHPPPEAAPLALAATTRRVEGIARLDALHLPGRRGAIALVSPTGRYLCISSCYRPGLYSIVKPVMIAPFGVEPIFSIVQAIRDEPLSIIRVAWGGSWVEYRVENETVKRHFTSEPGIRYIAVNQAGTMLAESGDAGLVVRDLETEGYPPIWTAPPVEGVDTFSIHFLADDGLALNIGYYGTGATLVYRPTAKYPHQLVYGRTKASSQVGQDVLVTYESETCRFYRWRRQGHSWTICRAFELDEAHRPLAGVCMLDDGRVAVLARNTLLIIDPSEVLIEQAWPLSPYGVTHSASNIVSPRNSERIFVALRSPDGACVVVECDIQAHNARLWPPLPRREGEQESAP